MKRARGRPLGSNIRQNLVDLMARIGENYAYQIYKHYIKVFPKATMRSIYYQLQKGIETGEFVIKKVLTEEGNYSWGRTAEKTYYGIGKNAKARKNVFVEEYLNKIEIEKKLNN